MSDPMRWVRASRPAMGTVFEVILAGEDASHLRCAADAALEEVERLDMLLSPYQPSSEIHRLNESGNSGWVRLDAEVFHLLDRALTLARESEGAFDPVVGALIRCWGFFRGRGQLPTPEAVAAARERSGWHLVEVDADRHSVRLLRVGVEVHPGAFGKGYAVDRAISILREWGVTTALVHGGTSTLYALGAPPGEDAWHIGLCDPDNRETRMAVARLKDRALSTSGDYEQFFEIDGRRFSHVLDPRTGFPAQGTRCATVTAECALDTDALSTALFVSGEGWASELLEKFPQTAAALVPDAPACDDTDAEAATRRLIVLGEWELLPAEPSPD